MAWCIVDKQIEINEDGDLVSREGNIPAFIHQYNRYDSLYLRMNRLCGVVPDIDDNFSN
jgi:hypothetical protein